MLNRAASAKSSIEPPPTVGAFAVDGPLRLIGASMRFTRNSEIYGEQEPAEYLYQIISGTVRTYRMLDNGRRQISAFYFPGDVFGIEAGDVHLSSADAICDAQILVAKRSALMARAEHEKSLARQLWMLTVRELQRVQEHSLALIKSAEERVAGFLIEMAGRNAGGAAVELPMSRQDIADYLGLTIETVSRTFSQFAQSGTIALENSRRVQLCNRPALGRLNA